MARNVAILALGIVVGVIGGAAFQIHAADESDMGGADLTGKESDDTGEHIVPEVEAVPSPAPQPVSQADLTVGSPAQVQYGVWDRLAECESSSRWHIASGNGFYGGLQFDKATWARHGGLAYAWRADVATREQQILIAQRTQASQGWSAWPYCSRHIGLR